VILEYLEERYPEPPLMPRDVALRARCRQLELEADEVLFQHVWGLIDSRFYPGGNEERAEAAAKGATEYYARLASFLGSSDYLCGAFSTADIAQFIMVFVASSLGAPLPESQPKLKAWLERVAARPAVAREVEAVAASAAAA
jgi:glutathione S-transferase